MTSDPCLISRNAKTTDQCSLKKNANNIKSNGAIESNGDGNQKSDNENGQFIRKIEENETMGKTRNKNRERGWTFQDYFEWKYFPNSTQAKKSANEERRFFIDPKSRVPSAARCSPERSFFENKKEGKKTNNFITSKVPSLSWLQIKINRKIINLLQYGQ